jgi:hypothetical protein
MECKYNLNFIDAIRLLKNKGGCICRPRASSCFMELTHGKWLVYLNAEEDDNYPQLFVEDYLADDWIWRPAC